MWTLTFYYDVLSPYSFLAFRELVAYTHGHGHDDAWKDVRLRLRPVFLAAIVAATENVSTPSIPAKAAYAYLDVARVAKYHDVRLRPPREFKSLMSRSYEVMRVIAAAQAIDTSADQAMVLRVTYSLWRALWMEKKNILDVQAQEGSLRAAGLSDQQARDLIASARTVEIKALLKTNTEEAVDIGAFGVPTILIENDDKSVREMVFGSDRFHIIAQIIGQPWNGPLFSELEREGALLILRSDSSSSSSSGKSMFLHAKL